MLDDQGAASTQAALEILPAPPQDACRRSSLHHMTEDIAGHLHPGVTHMALPAYVLNAPVRDPHVYMDDITAASWARHHKTMAIYVLRLSHQATLGPEPLIVADGVAVGRGSSLAFHLGLVLVR